MNHLRTVLASMIAFGAGIPGLAWSLSEAELREAIRLREMLRQMALLEDLEMLQSVGHQMPITDTNATTGEDASESGGTPAQKRSVAAQEVGKK